MAMSRGHDGRRGRRGRARRDACRRAKVQIGRSAKFIGQQAMQLHGGIAMTYGVQGRPLVQAPDDDRHAVRRRRPPPLPGGRSGRAHQRLGSAIISAWAALPAANFRGPDAAPRHPARQPEPARHRRRRCSSSRPRPRHRPVPGGGGGVLPGAERPARRRRWSPGSCASRASSRRRARCNPGRPIAPFAVNQIVHAVE